MKVQDFYDVNEFNANERKYKELIGDLKEMKKSTIELNEDQIHISQMLGAVKIDVSWDRIFSGILKQHIDTPHPAVIRKKFKDMNAIKDQLIELD